MNARQLIVGWGAGLAGALLFAPMAGTALDRLAVARAERDGLRATATTPARPVPLLAPGLAVRAPDAATARARTAARVQALAKAGGVLVEEVAGVPAPAGTIALRLRVSGAEKAVLAFADALERDKPVLRLGAWQVEALPGGSVRLSGELVAGWQ